MRRELNTASKVAEVGHALACPPGRAKRWQAQTLRTLYLMRSAAAAVALSAILLAAASFAMPQAADAAKGKEVFQRRCGGCHSLDRSMEGPRLRGVYGRRSGSAPDFQYSEALKKAKITWDDGALGKWLTDTEALVPDNDMTFRVQSADERRDIIAYLKTLSQ
jgi:cytochrome c